MSKGLEKYPVEDIDIEELVTPPDSESDTPTESTDTAAPDDTSSTEHQNRPSQKGNGEIPYH
jgi:hypothetical protein